MRVKTDLKAGVVRLAASGFELGDKTLTLDEDGFIQEPE